MELSIISQPEPAAAAKEAIAGWVLASIGIIPRGEKNIDAHPATRILLELAERRQKNRGAVGREIVQVAKIGKTQAYYWLNKLLESGIISRGKHEFIEFGAKYELKGYYLADRNLVSVLREAKKNADAEFEKILSVSERLQNILKSEKAPPPERKEEPQAPPYEKKPSQ